MDSRTKPCLRIVEPSSAPSSARHERVRSDVFPRPPLPSSPDDAVAVDDTGTPVEVRWESTATAQIECAFPWCGSPAEAKALSCTPDKRLCPRHLLMDRGEV